MLKGQNKNFPKLAIKGYRGSGDTVPLILKLGTR
jgi:hypothetical protein